MNKRIINMTFLFLLLCGCNFPLLSRQGESSLTATAQMELTLTAQNVLTPSAETSTGSVGQCYFNWAVKSLPRESALLQDALELAGVPFISAVAEAYGENCIDSVSNEPISFSTMETDFHVSLPVDDLNDEEEMGNTAYKVIKIILDFPEGSFPGHNPGYIGINFKSETDEINFWFQISFIQKDIQNGVKGIELFNKLNS
jgi:hypothetical protein